MKREYVLPQAPLDFDRAEALFRVCLFAENRKAPKVLVCMACGSTEGVALESSRTAYVKHCSKKECHACEGLLELCLDGVAPTSECPNWPKEDPNAPIPLCRACAKQHHEYWDEVWREYRTGQM